MVGSWSVDGTMERLRDVRALPETDRFQLVPIFANAHLSRTQDGRPCVVFLVPRGSKAAGLRSLGLRLDTHESAEVRLEGTVMQHALVLLATTTLDTEREFCVLVGDLRERLQSSPGAFGDVHAVREFFLRWSELFSPTRAPSFEELVGLWGELYILGSLLHPDRGVACWNGPESAIHDFGANGVYVEVKTSTRGHVHTFGLTQVEPTANTQLLIASLYVRPDPAGGTTVEDMILQIGAQLKEPIALEKKLLSLGWDRSTFSTTRYRLVNVAFHRGELVPRPREIDPGVMNVRFTVDLSSVSTINKAEVDRALKMLVKASARSTLVTPGA